MTLKYTNDKTNIGTRTKRRFLGIIFSQNFLYQISTHKTSAEYFYLPVGTREQSQINVGLCYSKNYRTPGASFPYREKPNLFSRARSGDPGGIGGKIRNALEKSDIPAGNTKGIWKVRIPLWNEGFLFTENTVTKKHTVDHCFEALAAWPAGFIGENHARSSRLMPAMFLRERSRPRSV